LKNASGDLFGIGTNADQPFYVDIKVSGTPVSTPTPTTAPATGTPTFIPTSTPTRTTVPATGTPTFTPTPTAVPATATATPTATSSTTGDWSTYQNVKYGFHFKFPPGSTVDNQWDSGWRLYLPIIAGTNLVQKLLDVNVGENVSSCNVSGTHRVDTSENVTFNGIQFLKETWSEGATSHMGDFTVYSTTKGNACISLSFLLWSVVPEVMETPPPVFNRAAESAVFSTIMSTYANQ
jgi:hypothetical protein